MTVFLWSPGRFLGDISQVLKVKINAEPISFFWRVPKACPWWPSAVIISNPLPWMWRNWTVSPVSSLVISNMSWNSFWCAKALWEVVKAHATTIAECVVNQLGNASYETHSVNTQETRPLFQILAIYEVVWKMCLLKDILFWAVDGSFPLTCKWRCEIYPL